MAILPTRVPKTRNRDPRPFGFGIYTKVANGGGLSDDGPVISSPSSGTPGATSATITWTTNLPATSMVKWGLTTAYAGASSPIHDPQYLTSHSITITGLTTATTYHYQILSALPGSGYTVTTDATFVTA